MASELGVQTIQHTNGTDALTVGSDGTVNAPVGMTVGSKDIGSSVIYSQDVTVTTSGLQITNVFSNDYKMYRVFFYLSPSTSSTYHFIRFIKSDGTVDSSAIYSGYVHGYASNDFGGVNRGSTNHNDNKLYIDNTGDANAVHCVEATIFHPYDTNETMLTMQTMLDRNSSNGYALPQQGAGMARTSNSYTGLFVEATTGQSTGFIKVMGIG